MVCGFIFDIIIVRIDTPSQQFDDPNLLSVDVNFNNVSLSITSSRINVADFRSGRSYEFEANPDDLRADLENCPLKLEVKYAGETVGSGKMVWPQSVLSRVKHPFGELTHVDESELTMGDKKIGIVEIIVRLRCKCTDVCEMGYPKTGDEIRKQLDKVINPHDILFVVGDTHKEDDCGGMLPTQISQDDRYTTALDLSLYRSMNGRLVQSPDVLSTCVNTDCCEMKMNMEYQKLLDSIGCGREESREKRRPVAHCGECPQETKCSSSSTRDSSVAPDYRCPCFTVTHPSGAFANEKLINICPHTPPSMSQTLHHTPRHCPVCKENLSWIPKLACCPKCGYKPVPYIEEKPYNEKLTAEQILQEYLEKRSSQTDQKASLTECCKEETKCRCTCQAGKTCAHCRIRKLCEDIFQTNSTKMVQDRDANCGNCEQKSSEMYNICQTSSKDCRPYLARVFSELRDLYDIKKAKKNSFNLDERCERELNSTAAKRALRTPRSTKKKKHDEDAAQRRAKRKKRKQQQAKAKTPEPDSDAKEAKGKPKYNYTTDRTAPTSQARHINCNTGFAVGRKNVPRNMGWLWNIDTCGIRRGWKPGAIRKPIKEMMKFFLKDFPADTIRVSQYSYRDQSGAKGDCKDEEELVQKPTLHICKKNDEYFITLRPLKDPDALKECADPYLNMKPIQFKITKNPLLCELRKLKRCLKEMGFNKCTCHKPVIECFCRSFLDKKRLEYQLKKECRKRGVPCCADSLVLSDTTDSDVEFDFGVTPPAGVIKPERAKKPNLVNHGTQYKEGDWNIPNLFPKPINRYMKLYDCATDGHYGPGGGRGGRGGHGRGGHGRGGGGGGGFHQRGGRGGGWGGRGGGGGGFGGGGGGGRGGGAGGGGGGFGPGGGGGRGGGAGGGGGGFGPGGGGGRGGGAGGQGGGPGGRGGGAGGRGGGTGNPGGGWGPGGPGGRGGGAGGGGGGWGPGGPGGRPAAGGGGPGGRGGGAGGPGGGWGPGGRGGGRGGRGGGRGGRGGGGGGGGVPSKESQEKRRRMLGEMPPPLLCMVDRRGKPDPCEYICYDRPAAVCAMQPQQCRPC